MHADFNANQIKQEALYTINTIHRNMPFIQSIQSIQYHSSTRMVEIDINGMHYKVMQHKDYSTELEVTCEYKGIKFDGSYCVTDKKLDGSVTVTKDSSHDNTSAISILMHKSSGKDPEIDISTYGNDISWTGDIDSNGQPTGNGRLCHNGGLIFDGEYQDGHRNYGTEYSHNGKKIFIGKYKNDQRVDGTEYSEDGRCSLFATYINGQRNNIGPLTYGKCGEKNNTINCTEGRLVKISGCDTSLIENLNNIEIQTNGISQDGLYRFTVYCLEGHKNAGYECEIATDEQGTIIISILKTPDGRVFKGLIGEDYSMIEGNITNENGTVSMITLNNRWLFIGTLDKEGMPYQGKLYIPSDGANSITINFINGQPIVKNSEELIKIINLHLSSHTGFDELGIPPELFCPIGLLVIEDPVSLISANGIPHHFERKNLLQWLFSNKYNPVNMQKAKKKDIKLPHQKFVEIRNKWLKEEKVNIIKKIIMGRMKYPVANTGKQKLLNSSVISILYPSPFKVLEKI